MSEIEKNRTNEGVKMNRNSNVTRPVIELDDFYDLLDPKVVEKIKQTSLEERKRITESVSEYEYDIAGAKEILKSILK